MQTRAVRMTVDKRIQNKCKQEQSGRVQTREFRISVNKNRQTRAFRTSVNTGSQDEHEHGKSGPV